MERGHGVLGRKGVSCWAAVNREVASAQSVITLAGLELSAIQNGTLGKNAMPRD
jgi:hypothetical protein